MKKVMIIDDNELDHYISKYMLKEVDKTLEIKSIFNGHDALAALEKDEKPDLILLDINMPQMSGYEFIEQYSSSDYYSDIPIIVCSSSVLDRENFVSNEYVTDYFVKSLQIEDLNKIRTYL